MKTHTQPYENFIPYSGKLQSRYSSQNRRQLRHKRTATFRKNMDVAIVNYGFRVSTLLSILGRSKEVLDPVDIGGVDCFQINRWDIAHMSNGTLTMSGVQRSVSLLVAEGILIVIYISHHGSCKQVWYTFTEDSIFLEEKTGLVFTYEEQCPTSSKWNGHQFKMERPPVQNGTVNTSQISEKIEDFISSETQRETKRETSKANVSHYKAVKTGAVGQGGKEPGYCSAHRLFPKEILDHSRPPEDQIANNNRLIRELEEKRKLKSSTQTKKREDHGKQTILSIPEGVKSGIQSDTQPETTSARGGDSRPLQPLIEEPRSDQALSDVSGNVDNIIHGPEEAGISRGTDGEPEPQDAGCRMSTREEPGNREDYENNVALSRAYRPEINSTEINYGIPETPGTSRTNGEGCADNISKGEVPTLPRNGILRNYHNSLATDRGRREKRPIRSGVHSLRTHRSVCTQHEIRLPTSEDPSRYEAGNTDESA